MMGPGIAYAAHPERFVNGIPSPPKLAEAVWINPPLSGLLPEHAEMATQTEALPAFPGTLSGEQAVSRGGSCLPTCESP